MLLLLLTTAASTTASNCAKRIVATRVYFETRTFSRMTILRSSNGYIWVSRWLDSFVRTETSRLSMKPRGSENFDCDWKWILVGAISHKIDSHCYQTITGNEFSSQSWSRWILQKFPIQRNEFSFDIKSSHTWIRTYHYLIREKLRYRGPSRTYLNELIFNTSINPCKSGPDGAREKIREHAEKSGPSRENPGMWSP